VLGAILEEVARSDVGLDTSPPAPLPVDRWVASSALQKAVRRGEALIALRAGLSYLSLDRAGFWRRLPVIAAEDIGIGDWEVVTQVIAASTDSDTPTCGRPLRAA